MRTAGVVGPQDLDAPPTPTSLSQELMAMASAKQDRVLGRHQACQLDSGLWPPPPQHCGDPHLTASPGWGVGTW